MGGADGRDAGVDGDERVSQVVRSAAADAAVAGSLRVGGRVVPGSVHMWLAPRAAVDEIFRHPDSRFVAVAT